MKTVGTWGIGIMENDLALDVKGVFERALQAGKSLSSVVATVRGEFARSAEDPDLVLALAWLAKAQARIPADLQEQAVQIIAGQQSLRRWEGSDQYAERQTEEERFLKVLRGECPHPDAKKRTVAISLKVGDILRIPLSNGQSGFGHYLFYDPRYGHLLQVYRLKTDNRIPEPTEILWSGPLFPPVITSLVAATKHWGWKVVSNTPVTGFQYPTFKSGRDGNWWLYDGKGDRRVSELPPGGDEYEYLLIWGHDDLLRRIEDGANPLSPRR